MRGATLGLGLLLAACSPAIDADRCFDERCPAGSVCVAGACAQPGDTGSADAGAVDMARPTDMADLADMAAAADCTPIRPLTSTPPPPLWASELTEIARFGVPAAPDGFDATDLDGDGLVDTVALVGGTLQATDGARDLRWRVDAPGATALAGALDLDGDGRVEVVAYGDAALEVFDGLTGRSVWSLTLGGAQKSLAEFQSVDRVFIGPRGLDGRRSLVVTDRGCGQQQGGTQAVALRLDGGEVDEIPLEVGGEVTCPVEALFGRPGPTAELGFFMLERGRQQLIVQADPVTGRRRWCGQTGELTGPLLRVVDLLPDRPGAELLAHDREGWEVFATVEGEWVDCEQVGPVLPARADYTNLIRDELAVIDVEGDGRPELAVTELDDGIRVRVQRPDPQIREGGTVGTLDNARVAGEGFGGDDLLVNLIAVNQAAASIGGAGRVRFGARGQVESLWPDAIAEARIARVSRLGPVVGRSQVPRPVWLRHPEGARVLVEQDRDRDGQIDTLLAVDADGQQAAWRAPSLPLTYRVVCEPATCDTTDRLLVLTVDGQVHALSPTLTALDQKSSGVPAPPVAGAIHLGVAPGPEPRLIAAVQASPEDPRYVLLVAQDPRTGARWSTLLGGAVQPPVVLPRPDAAALVAHRTQDRDGVTWQARAADTGEVVWTHTLDDVRPQQTPLVPLPVEDGRLALRLDLSPGQPQADCAHTELGDLATPLPCGVPGQPRRITALDAADGQCVWQLTYAVSDPCEQALDPALERLSVVASADGDVELYLTEPGGLHRLAAATGAVLHSAAVRSPGGGLVVAHPDGERRVRAGAGPLEQWDPLLTNADQASDAGRVPYTAALTGPEAVWLRRDETLWRASPSGDGLAVSRVAIEAGTLTVDPASDGAPITGLAWAPGLAEDGGDAVVATTADHLVGLALDEVQSWSRALPAGPRHPQVLDLDGDGAPDLVLALADGRVVQGAQRALSPPAEVQIQPCGAAVACEERAAPLSDVGTEGEALCATFRPVAEADGHEARLMGPGGTPLTGWEPAVGGVAQLSLLDAQPGRAQGAAHRIEVRAWRVVDDVRETSVPRASAPVGVADRRPPGVTVTVADGAAVASGAPVTFLVDAEDDHALASRRVEVVDGAGRPYWGTELGPLRAGAWSAAVGFNGLGGEPLGPLPPGDYAARVVVGDVAGRTQVETAPFVVCDGPCE